jgi:hypothetical protein
MAVGINTVVALKVLGIVKAVPVILIAHRKEHFDISDLTLEIVVKSSGVPRLFIGYAVGDPGSDLRGSGLVVLYVVGDSGSPVGYGICALTL